MQDNNYNIDKQFTDKAWENMQAMLDKELPVGKQPNSKPKLLPLWVSIGVAASLLIAWQFTSFIGDDKVANKTIDTAVSQQQKTNAIPKKLKTNQQNKPNQEIVQLYDSKIDKSNINNSKSIIENRRTDSSVKNELASTKNKKVNKVNTDIVKNKKANSKTTNRAIELESLLDTGVKNAKLNEGIIATNKVETQLHSISNSYKPVDITINTMVANDVSTLKANNNSKEIGSSKIEINTPINNIVSKTIAKNFGRSVIASLEKVDASLIDSDQLALANLRTEEVDVPIFTSKVKWKKFLKLGVGANITYQKPSDNSMANLATDPRINQSGLSMQAKEAHLGLVFQKPIAKKFAIETGINTAFKSSKNTNQNALTAALESTDDTFESPSGYIYNVENYADPASLGKNVATYIVPANTESVSASIPVSLIYQPCKKLSFRAGVYGSYRLNKLELANFRDISLQRKLESSENSYTNHFDYGVNTGFRYNANKKLAFDFNYDQGFIPEIKNDNELKKNRVFQVSSLINLNRP